MITNKVITAYNKCPTLSFKYFKKEKGILTSYEKLINSEKLNSKINFTKKLALTEFSEDFISNNSGYFQDINLFYDKYSAKIEILRKDGFEIIPIIFVQNGKVSRDVEIEFEWIKFVFEKNGFQVNKGKICSGNQIRNKKILSTKKIKKTLFHIEDFIAKEPRIVKNNYCTICEFSDTCYSQLKKKDDISLLRRVTRKQVLNFEKKGIFTIRQLSYTYKPRKKKKKYRENYIYKPELQALAIRSRKIFVQKKPNLEKNECELFFDIEGISEENDYYLFGILVSFNGAENYYHFYCKEKDDEKNMWVWFLKTVLKYEGSKIYHYGSYEKKVIKKLAQKYKTNIDLILDRLVNVNESIFAKIYFPVYSNSLKEICNYLGFNWTIPKSDGIQSIIWRKLWKNEKDDNYIEKAVIYNKDDCVGLSILKKYLNSITESGDTISEVDYVKTPKDYSSIESKITQEQFKLVLKVSYEYYENTKISFREDKSKEKKKTQIRGDKKGYQGQRKKRPRPTKTVIVNSDKNCPKHPELILRPTKRVSNRLIIDLKLTSTGIRKEIVHYKGIIGYCKVCQEYFVPEFIKSIPQNTLYGQGFKAYICYNRVALRTPYQKIGEFINEQFNEKIHWAYTVHYIDHLAKYYHETINQIIEKLISGKIMHVDETSVNIRGETQFAWIFTNGKYVYFKLGKTREADLPIDFLKEFKGTLISDFYSAYDNIDCKQQKCWVHLLRDINQDLRQNPFDIELEKFVVELRKVIIPIMETVQRFGVKKRYLKKHESSVSIFYKSAIDDKNYKSENVCKYQKRFSRYRDSLFTFIKDDGIPWHNNQAERGIRHLVKQMAISGGFHESHAPAYLTLLSIMQTCRFTNKSFFQFLFSQKTDLESFKIKRK